VDWAHWAGIVGRSLAVYVAVVAAFRFGGRRELAQLEPFDVVLLLLVANAVQNAMVGADVTVGGGLLAAGTLFAANYVVSWASAASPTVRRIVEGEGYVLIEDGRLNERALRHAHLRQEDVERIIQERLNRVVDIAQIRKAVIEVDGTVSVLTDDDEMTRTTEKLPSRRFRRRYRPVG
jgi:uncharacterized membrane protein YcaP (DUF421 family)